MYIADLHIHSRFSMATSRQLTVRHLAGWAMCKGINVLGTGDFTHPAWQAELERDLEFDEGSGFYRLKGQPDRIVVEKDMEGVRPPLFCLQTEISSIYKRGGKSRRVHNLVFFRHLDDVKRFSKRLGQIGNIESDGRPILGLDSRDLLELVLETADSGVLIPAHIWTPWFSLFGSRSGFDAIEECFGDLTKHIFALETGLSSDPAMNRLVSALDGYALISNSDAHSGANLGREANLFHGSPTYDGMFAALRRAALRTGHEGMDEYFEGTLEIYPEEGKYHLDGHRNCQVVMTPEESASCGNICPVCGRPLTIGVLHRVWELADRRESAVLPNEPAVHPIIPLPTVLGQMCGAAPTGRVVAGLFQDALEHLGSEFGILASLPVDRIAEYNPWLAEAVRRIRTGELELRGGYDGEFGTIKVFSDEELREVIPAVAPARGRRGRRPACGGDLVAAAAAAPKAPASAGKVKSPAVVHQAAARPAPGAAILAEKAGRKLERGHNSAAVRLTAEQEHACAHRGGPLMVVAGPGSGKTRLLTERLVRLLKEGVPAGDILALTFSRRAAGEMEERVRQRLPEGELPFCGTFHALAWRELRAAHPGTVLLSDVQTRALLQRAVSEAAPAADAAVARQLQERYWLMRERCEEMPPESDVARLARRYAALKQEGGRTRVDFTDLLEWLAGALGSGTCHLRPAHVLVDEVQDLSLLQLRLLKELAATDGKGFFGIGDPDQAIYGFRGAAPDIVERFREQWTNLEVTGLTTSFRSSQRILDAAGHAFGAARRGGMTAARTLSAELTACEAATQGLEERWVAEQVLALLPISSHTLQDERSSGAPALTGTLNPSDVAVLVRVRAQIPSLARALWKLGVPVQTPSLEQFWQEEGMDRVLAWVEERLGREGSGLGLGPLAGAGFSTASPAALLPLLRAEGQADDGLAESDGWRQLERVYEAAGSWEKVFEEMRWRQEVDLLQSRAESVRLLTMHAAKGLEFRAVFLPGFNEGLMPLDRELLAGRTRHCDAQELEEERRLLYVAMTRASQAVFVSWARERHCYGRELTTGPSPFWSDLAGSFAARRLVRRERVKMVQGSLL